MKISGRTHCFGDDINTDYIIASKYKTASLDPRELTRHLMEDIDPGFGQRVRPGDILVAGKNFGCGSSREGAPLVIKAAGISVVVAPSFARIFFRNAINVGLPFLELEGVEKIADGDELEIDLGSGIIKNLTRNESYKTQAFPEFLQEIVKHNGLMNWIKHKGEK